MWAKENFDYPGTDDLEETPAEELLTLIEQMSLGHAVIRDQDKFLQSSNNEGSAVTLVKGNKKRKIREKETYEVEEITRHRKNNRITEYLVKWKGYNELSWVPEDNFNTKECIDEYWRMEED